jgi:doublecortin-like kinase 1/2
MIAKSESFTTRIDDSSFDRDFIRARNISVFAHGNKPRKMSRVLLNKKTVHSMDGILDDISDSLGIGCAIKKLVSIPNGLAIQKLEDLFDHCTLFIAMTSTKAKLTPQDLQLHKDEIKTLPSKLTPRSRARPVTASRARSTSIQNSSKTTPKTSRSGITRSFSVGNQWPKEIQDRLIIGDKLGAGYFAEVRFALDRKNGEDVAVKIIDRLKCRGKENMIEAEIRIMKKVRHPFIVELLDDIKSQQNIFLIIELV